MMRSILKKFFSNCQMAKRIGYKLPTGSYVSYGIYDFENFVSYTHEKFYFHISKDTIDLFGSTKILIRVGSVTVYENGWRHSVPQPMVKQICEILDKIKVYNKECSSNRLRKSYCEYEKSKNLKRKEYKIDEYEKEKQKLIDMFE